MVLPLIPIVAGASLLGGGAGIGWGLGKKDKSTTTTYAPVITKTDAWQYSPVQTYAPTIQYQLQSPGAQQISKKTIETVSKPSQSLIPQVTAPVTGKAAAGSGISTGVVAIAAAAVVVGLFLMKKK